MFTKLNPIAHGQHNNIYLTMKIGRTKKNPIILLKFVGFFDLECALISHSNLHKDYQNLLDFENLKEIVRSELDKIDFKFILFSNEDFFNRNCKTKELLIKLKDENTRTVSIA